MGRRFIPVFEPAIGELELEYVTDAVRSGWVSSLGPYLERLEDEFARYCGTKYALAVSNGTNALHLILSALDIGPGDEVVVPDLSFIASANAVAYCGAHPVFADIDVNTLCLDPASFEAAISPKTKAVMPVHLYGHPCDMSEINRIAEKHGIIVVEDAAEALGAQIGETRVGAFGRAAAFSLYGNKNITSGEGGMITTNDQKFYHIARHLRDQAMSKEKRYWHDRIGFNYRMTNMQAALALAQLRRVDEFARRKREILEAYRRGLSRISNRIRTNRQAIGTTPAIWAICIEVLGMDEIGRTRLIDHLRANGIDSRPYFYPMSAMPMYRDCRKSASNAAALYASGFNPPSSVLLADDDVKYICSIIEGYIENSQYLTAV